MKFLNILLLSMLMFFCSCGYKFSGKGDLPKGIKKIYIKIFENKSSETGAENILTNDVISEFISHDKIILSKEKNSEAVLSSEITSAIIETISHKTASISNERRITFYINMKLKSSNDEIIRSYENIMENETYDVSTDSISAEQNKRLAIQKLSKRIAERIYKNLTDDF